MDFIRFLLAIFFIILIAYFFSNDKRNINWRLIFSGLLLQIVFAILIFNVPFVENIFKIIIPLDLLSYLVRIIKLKKIFSFF